MMSSRLRLPFVLLATCLLLALSAAPGLSAQDATATPSDPTTPPPTLTETPLPTATATETATLTPAPTLTETATLTLEPTLTPVPLPSETGTATAEATGTETGTPAGTATETGTATATASQIATATANSTATASSTPIGSNLPVLYSETFENPIIWQWVLPIYRLIVSSGTGHALHVTNLLPLAPGSIGDVVLQGNVQITAGGAAFGVRHSGVGMYYAQLDINGQVSLYRTDVLLATAVVQPSNAGQWRNLQLAAIGNVITVTIDGTPVLSATDTDTLPPGTTFVSVESVAGGNYVLDDLVLQGLVVDPQTLPPDTYIPQQESPQQQNIQSSFSLLAQDITASKIAYETSNYDVAVMNSDGTNHFQVASSSSFDMDPSISSNGKVAFVSNRIGSYEIYVVGTDGTNLTHVTTGLHPSWSPDNTSLVFIRGTIHKINLSTGVEVMFNTTGGASPKWSPDGQRIAFTNSTPTGGEFAIYVVNADGSNLTQLTPDTYRLSTSDWSPDGSELLANNAQPVNHPLGSNYGSVGIIVIDSNTGAFKRQLTTIVADGDAIGLAWSPDGTQILFGRYQNLFERGLYTLPSQGGGASSIPNGLWGFGIVADWGLVPIPVTPTPTPQACNFLMQDYATIPTFANAAMAQQLAQFLLGSSFTPGSVIQDGFVTRMELRRIRDKAASIGQFDTSLLRRLDNHAPGFIFDPTAILQVTGQPNQGIASGVVGGQQVWFATGYGFSCGNNLTTNSSLMDTTDFVIPIVDATHPPQVTTTLLYTSPLTNNITDANGLLIPPSIDTNVDMAILHNHILNGLAEYDQNSNQCAGDANCLGRVFTRMMLDGNNRFDDLIIQFGNEYSVPPLFLKVLLMQESGLAPGLTKNGANAVGIGQFTPIASIDLGRFLSGTNDISFGELHLASVDGIQGITPYDVIQVGYSYVINAEPTDVCFQPAKRKSVDVGSAQSPRSEAECINFDETGNAIRSAAFFLSESWTRYIKPVIDQYWPTTPIPDDLKWPLAAASYNFGPGSVTDALHAVGGNNGTLTIQNLCPLLASETQQYVKNTRNGTPGARATGACS